MNDDLEALEAELAALQPAAPSSALKDRIGAAIEQRDETPPRHGPSMRRPVARAGGMAAAVGLAAAVAFAIFLRDRAIKQPGADVSSIPLPLVTALDDSLPTVWNYERALARSSRELEKLLDKHAPWTPPTPTRARTWVFIQSDSQLPEGEL